MHSFSFRRSRLFIWNFFREFQIQKKYPAYPVNPVQTKLKIILNPVQIKETNNPMDARYPNKIKMELVQLVKDVPEDIKDVPEDITLDP